MTRSNSVARPDDGIELAVAGSRRQIDSKLIDSRRSRLSPHLGMGLRHALAQDAHHLGTDSFQV